MLNLPVWDKPAQPCLSSRIPYGTPVTIETLSQIEKAEDFLRALGLREVRARHHDQLCRIEASQADLDTAFRRRHEIAAGLKRIGYLWGLPGPNPPPLRQPQRSPKAQPPAPILKFNPQTP